MTVLDFAAPELAVSLLVPFGDSIQVLWPPDGRLRLAELGHQLPTWSLALPDQRD